MLNSKECDGQPELVRTTPTMDYKEVEESDIYGWSIIYTSIKNHARAWKRKGDRYKFRNMVHTF